MGSSTGSIDHPWVAVLIVVVPPARVISPTVRVASCRYGTPPSWDSTSRHRSRRPNIPCVHPCDGNARSVASTASRFLGSAVSPVGRPTAARTAGVSPGRFNPAAAWWWSMAVTLPRCVFGVAGQPARNATTVSGWAGRSWLPVTAHQSVNRAQSAA